MIKKLMPLMAVLVLTSAPANAMSVSDAAAKAKGMASKAVNALVVKPVKAVAGFANRLVQKSLTVAGSVSEAATSTVGDAVDTAAGMVK